MSQISFFGLDSTNTATIDNYTYQVIKQLDLVAPTYNKIVLSEIKNTYHEQAQIFKSNLVTGYKFEDEENAKSIIEFLKNNLYDQKDRKISFMSYLSTSLFNDAIYYSFFDQLAFSNNQVVKMYPLSPKYLYTNRKGNEWVQIIPDAKFADIEPETLESNRDYTKNLARFSVPDSLSETKSNQEVFEFSGVASRSDFYPNILYLEATKGIKTNRLIGTYNTSWLESGSKFRQVLKLIGVDPDNEMDQQNIAEWKRKLNSSVSGAGEVLVIPVSSSEGQIEFMNPAQSAKEDFSQIQDSNRDEILAGNGTNPTLLGIKTNESSLTSTSQNEAINLYIETHGNNKIKLLQEHYDAVFKYIDPNYNTKIIFDTFKIEDKKENTEIDTIQIQNEDKLIIRGNIDDVNHYRKKIGKKEYSPADFKQVKESLSFNVDFGTGNE
jgi:hypothetical protein